MLLIYGLRWRRAAEAREDHGSECLRFACITEPRVFLLMQRTGPDAPWVETFHVKGVSTQHWHSAREAIAAAESLERLIRAVSPPWLASPLPVAAPVFTQVLDGTGGRTWDRTTDPYHVKEGAQPLILPLTAANDD